MSPTTRVGWVVDVQNDFMLPTGRLYVHNLFDPDDPGAIVASDAITWTVDWMRRTCDVLVFTGDWHAYGDPEIDPVAPDATRGTYPPHCMGLSSDPAERVGAALLATVDPGPGALILERDATAERARAVASRALAEHRPVFIQKRDFSVFTGNAATDAFLVALQSAVGAMPEFIVCGVATDVCVRWAVDGLLDRAARVAVVTDAVWGLGLKPPVQLFAAWRARGATLTTTDQLDAGRPGGAALER